MTAAVPLTAFCPECKAHRTFTVIQTPDRWRSIGHPVGCCVCGTSEREALVALSVRLSDDRDTIEEMAARLNTLDGELTELRDELHLHVSMRGNFAHAYIA